MRKLLSSSFAAMMYRQRPKQFREEPVSDLLRELPSEKYGNHPVQDYIAAFEGSEIRARRILDKGYESLVFDVVGDSVLKVTWLHLEPEFGKRPFDAPILHAGAIELGKRGLFIKRVNFFMQPKVEMRATDSDAASFGRTVDSLGYEFQDAGAHQLGYFESRLVLVDPFAVREKGTGHFWSADKIPYYNFG